MNLTSLVILALIIVLLFMGALWFVHLLQRKADIVDAGWALSVGITGALAGALATGDPTRRTLLILMSGVWALRLGLYLIVDRVRHPVEDGRYQTLRANWGASASKKFFLFFEVQGVLAVLLGIPFFVVGYNNTPPSFSLLLSAILLWVISVGGESISDRQLAKFRSDPANRGKTCRVGLWRYSRHPNYFFEWIHWWSYLPLAFGSEYALLALWSPIVVFILVTRVTGIPPTEERALKTRGADYLEYQRTTSAFIPWFPKV